MGVHLEESLHDRIKERAKAEGVSVDILVQRVMGSYLMKAAGTKGVAERMILELFDCGHGHYSTHEHGECEICHQGKPKARYRPDDPEKAPNCSFTRYWPAS